MQHAAAPAVGRIAQHRVVFLPPQSFRRILQIHFMHCDSLLQTVELHRPPRHIHAGALNLYRVKGDLRLPRAEQNGQDARARAQIHRPCPRREIGKVLQQHRVRAESKQAGMLDDPRAAALQIVDAFTLQKGDLFHIFLISQQRGAFISAPFAEQIFT